MTRNLAHPFLRRALVLALVLVGLCAPQTWGQITSQGTIAVKVLDPSGATVPDAKLTLEDLATSRVRTGVAESSGSYSFVALPVGTYRLTVAKSGFQSQVLESVAVQATRTTDVTVSLTVGTQSTQVTVSGQAPVVEKTSNAITGSIDLGRSKICQLSAATSRNCPGSFLAPLVTGAIRHGMGCRWPPRVTTLTALLRQPAE